MKADKTPVTLSAYDWSNAGLFLGVCTYAYESIGTIFNGRFVLLTASEKDNEGQDQDAEATGDCLRPNHLVLPAVFDFILPGKLWADR